MFDWLKNLLFDEEEVIVEEEQLNQINFSNVNDIETVLSNESVQEKKEEPVVNEQVQETPIIKTDLNIQFKDMNRKEEVEEFVHKRVERDKVEKRNRNKEKEIEINQVLSPMFGGKEVQSIEKVTMEAPVVKKKDGLGTVISPMYGQAELIAHEKEATIKLEKEKKEETPILQDDDWNDDVPLEELINTVEESDDCVQFSLFGENSDLNQ